MNCKFCEKELSKKGLSHELYCKDNPNRKDKSGINAPTYGKNWKGRSRWKYDKDGNPIVDEKYRERIKNTSTGRKMPDEAKKKISDSMIKYFMENPDMIPYIKYHSSNMSYPEKVFKNALESRKIEGWIYNYRNGIYQYDFAFPNLKIDVEIDGNTHTLDKIKKIDERRDKFSKSQGWIVIRFTASEVKLNVNICINKLLEILNYEKRLD